MFAGLTKKKVNSTFAWNCPSFGILNGFFWRVALYEQASRHVFVRRVTSCSLPLFELIPTNRPGLSGVRVYYQYIINLEAVVGRIPNGELRCFTMTHALFEFVPCLTLADCEIIPEPRIRTIETYCW